MAAKPWRLREAEDSLIGRRPAQEHSGGRPAGDGGAQPLTQNAFKVDLGLHSVVRALTLAAQMRAS